MKPLAPPLAVRGLTLQAAGQGLVRQLDWQVHSGERWGVVGRNAAGKSTLLRALAGLPVPSQSGEVQWFGHPLPRWLAADAARVRAFAPQHSTDRFPLSVRQLLGLVAPDDESALERTLQALDALHLVDRDVTRLSGGERQRVALAQCALQGTPLVLMDEPISFQDPGHQLVVARWLTGLSERALVFSAHDVNWIAQAATHVLALFGDGQWAAGPVAQMLAVEPLRRAYGCDWRQLGGLWQAC